MTNDRPSLTDLVARAQRGESAAVEELFRQCRTYLGVVARAHLETWMRSKVDASDIVQQTMLEAHRDLARFRGATGGELLGWLRRILAHNAADLLRQYQGTAKRKIGKEVVLDPEASVDGLANLADQACSPSQAAAQHEDELLLSAALDRLPEDYQEVILLRNLRRLSFDDVARQMGRSRPAVQMLWMRALKKLQQEMTAGRGS